MFPEMHLGRCATREIRVYDCIHSLVITVLQSREPEQLSRCLAVCGLRESEEGTTEMFPIRRTDGSVCREFTCSAQLEVHPYRKPPSEVGRMRRIH